MEITDLVDISTIKEPPIALIAGSADTSCPYAIAKQIKHKLGHTVTDFITIDNKDHAYFSYASGSKFID